jgi:hypothetical protein
VFIGAESEGIRLSFLEVLVADLRASNTLAIRLKAALGVPRGIVDNQCRALSPAALSNCELHLHAVC